MTSKKLKNNLERALALLEDLKQLKESFRISTIIQIIKYIIPQDQIELAIRRIYQKILTI